MKTLNTKLFIEKSHRIHGETYDYSKVVYVNNKQPVIITCLKHGDFRQIPNSHLLGKGCSRCGKCYHPSTSEFVERANKVHNGTYSYSRAHYTKATEKTLITCAHHGDFSQTPAMHLSGRGCPQCAVNCKKSLDYFVKKARSLHCGIYDYSQSSYVGTHTKTIIICPKHGKFLQTPAMHLSGNGCPKCKLSKGELRVWRWLSNNNYTFVSQKIFSDCVNPRTNAKLKFDFYLPREKILIEYNGEQHFWHNHLVGGKHRTTAKEYSDICYRDRLKVKYAKAKNLRLIRISYKDYDKIETLLRELICQKLLSV